jgi:hypothetical protein
MDTKRPPAGGWDLYEIAVFSWRHSSRNHAGGIMKQGPPRFTEFGNSSINTKYSLAQRIITTVLSTTGYIEQKPGEQKPQEKYNNLALFKYIWKVVNIDTSCIIHHKTYMPSLVMRGCHRMLINKWPVTRTIIMLLLVIDQAGDTTDIIWDVIHGQYPSEI